MSIRLRQWKNKDGTVTKKWLVDYSDNGGTRRNLQFDRKREAEKAWAKIQVQLESHSHIAARQSATVKECSDLWLTACEDVKGVERTTLDTYKRYKKEIDAELGAIKVTHLTTATVLAFRDRIAKAAKERGNTGDHATRLVLTLGAILHVAMKRGKVAQNVVRLLDKDDKGQDRHKPKLEVGVDIPTVDDIRRLIAQLDDPRFVKWRACFLILIFTGLRCSEVRGLPWNHVDLDKGELYVRQRADAYKKIGSPKTKGSRRTVPLIPTLVDILREHKLVTPKTDHNLVFPSKRGDVVDDSRIQMVLDNLQIAAGIVDDKGNGKYSPHKLRHFYASWCINAKTDGGLEWPIKKVSERLGHSSIRMTADRYGHLFPRGDDAAELAAANAMFFGNVPAPRPVTATVIALRPHAQEVPVEEALPMPRPIDVKEAPQPQQVPVDPGADHYTEVAVLPEPEPERERPAAPTPAPVAIPATVSAFERATAAILDHPDMSIRDLANKLGVSRPTIQHARAALKNPGAVSATVPVEGRSTLGQFLPGPRYTAQMARVETAVLANPSMSTQALAKKIGVNKTTVLRARRRLQSKSENPVSAPVSVEGRSTLGQFLPGPRYTAKMARVETAVLANPGMSAYALAKKIGVDKKTVRSARKRLQSKSENPVSGQVPPQPQP
jgi:integrase/DNA-binding XRE family transcriptional regulator